MTAQCLQILHHNLLPVSYSCPCLSVPFDLPGVLCIQGTISPGLAGLCLTYALDLTRFLKQGTAMASKTESDFNSAERIVQYLQPEPEASPDTKPEVAKSLPENWPAAGAVSVRNVTMRYRPEMPLVLKGVTFELGAGEKVGMWTNAGMYSPRYPRQVSLCHLL